MPIITYFGETDRGRVRSNNEDAFYICEGSRYCLVADGMGGAAAGEVASQIFADTAKKVFAGHDGRSEKETIARVQSTYKLANDGILRHVETNPHDKGMGCTAELLAFTRDGFILGHVGDSRTYRLRNNNLKQLTKDHSLVQEQVDQGVISPEEARSHAMRNVILRAVGVNEMVALDILKARLQPGDVFLLCSDGLTDMVEEPLVRATLAGQGSLRMKTETLIQLANRSGGKDNITVVLAAIS